MARSSSDFDRTVVSPSILRRIDTNKPVSPAFGSLGPSEWLLPAWNDPEHSTTNEPVDTQLAGTIIHEDEENDDDFQPPNKKQWSSLSLKKKTGGERFSKPVTSPQRCDAAKGVVHKLSNEWALRNVNAWMKNRNSISPSDPVLSDLLSCADASTLASSSVVSFKKQKKENGLPYPATTLRSPLAAIQRTLHSNKVPLIIFDKSDMRFRDLHITLDTVCASLSKEGVGTEVRHAAVIPIEHEDILWKKGVLGVATPESLLRTVFYTVELHFSLRGGQEYRDSKYSQFTRVPEEGYPTTKYVENGSKNYQGRFSETGQLNKIV